MPVPDPQVIDTYVGDYAQLGDEDRGPIGSVLDCVASHYLDSGGIVMAAAYYLAARCPDLAAEVETALAAFLRSAEASRMGGTAAEVRPWWDGEETTREAIAAYVEAHRDEAQADADAAAAAVRLERRRVRESPPDGVMVLLDLGGDRSGHTHVVAFFPRRHLERLLALADRADAIARETYGFRALELNSEWVFWLRRLPDWLAAVQVPYDVRWTLVEEAHWPATFRGDLRNYEPVRDLAFELGPHGGERLYVRRDGFEFGYQGDTGPEVRTYFLPARPLQAWLATRT